MTRPSLLPYVLASLLVAGCSSFQPRVGTGSGLPGLPGPQDPARPAPVDTDDLREDVDTRSVCRSAAFPRGWIAIDYVEAGSQCPRLPRRPDAPNGATIVELERYAVGAVLEICADQPVPSYWQVVASGQDAGQCAGARVDEGEPRTRLIRRLR